MNPDAPLVPGTVDAEWQKIRMFSPARDGGKVLADDERKRFGKYVFYLSLGRCRIDP